MHASILSAFNETQTSAHACRAGFKVKFKWSTVNMPGWGVEHCNRDHQGLSK
jgi:hypothetical protein